MPKTATVLRIFVASPSDVSEERQRLEDVVESLNCGFAAKGVQLKLVRWERDASPRLGEDAQSVINKQLLADYDIFVGIMWKTVGTPTKRAESGTIEEFENALERFQEDSSVVVMMYFKNAPPSSMEQIDPDQLKKVNEFRSKIKGLGLYHSFDSPEHFSAAIHTHLLKIMLNHIPSGPTVSITVEATAAQNEGAKAEEQELVELKETFEAEMTALTAVLNRTADVTQEAIPKFIRKAADFDRFEAKISKTGLSQPRRADAQLLFGQAAQLMNEYVDAIQKELPLYKQHLYRGIDAISKAVPLAPQLGAERDELAKHAQILLTVTKSFLQTMEYFKSTVSELPPVPPPLAQTKRATEVALQEIIDAAHGGTKLLSDVMPLLD